MQLRRSLRHKPVRRSHGKKLPDGFEDIQIREYGVPDPLIRAVRSLYDQCQSLVRIAGNKLDSFPVGVGIRQGCPLSLILFILLWTGFLGAARVWTGSGLVTSGLGHCFLRMMWFCWLHQIVTSNSHWIGSLPSVKQLG